MPFSSAYKREHFSHDFHDQADFQSQILPVSASNKYQWHEMDFTTITPVESRLADSSSKYSVSMDTDQDFSYLQPNGLNEEVSPDGGSFSTNLFSTGPFSYSQLLNNMDNSTLSQTAIPFARSSSSNILEDELSTSPETGTNLVAPGEKICPLIAGQIDTCQPSRCGPDAPCMDFTSLPPIEECTSVPCISQPLTTATPASTPPKAACSSTKRLPLSRRTSTRRSSSSTVSSQDQAQTQIAPNRRTASATSRRRGKDLQSSTSPDSVKLDPKQRAKQAHSLVERKYRENLNAKIAQLHTTLRTTQYGPKFNAEDEDVANSDSDAEGVNMGSSLKANNVASSGASTKFRKSDVLTDAMSYVNQTEVEMRHMDNEITRLGERVRVLEKLVKCQDCSLLKSFGTLGVQAATAAM